MKLFNKYLTEGNKTELKKFDEQIKKLEKMSVDIKREFPDFDLSYLMDQLKQKRAEIASKIGKKK